MEKNHPNTEAEEAAEAEESSYGVLLYYKYTNIPDVQQLFNFYNSDCNSLHLLGRVRLSSNGVNVTVGGKMAALEKHIDSLRSNSLFDGTDFKLASCSEPLNDRVASECGFTSLSIRIVKELVTFSSCPLLKSPEVSNAGCHLSAVQFHSVLQSAGRFLESNDSSSSGGLVLLDARNLYETRIGKFDTTDVKTLDPEIRQYSDLPSWIDDNSERLRGNKILMYCTGGIRCEMASAYIKSKGAGFENVFQEWKVTNNIDVVRKMLVSVGPKVALESTALLYGGIQRYLEQFPDGGFFKGKNFVFDHRVSVGSMDPKVLGTCLLCSSAFDDYSSRSRCIYCRMLVLVCDSCRTRSSSYVCELCQKYGKNVLEFHESEAAELEAVSTTNQTSLFASTVVGNAPKISRKLRILCLHGFRQNASSFKGRTASLAKKLKTLAELVFIDAPHELSFIYQPSQLDKKSNSSSSPISQIPPSPKSCNKKYAWLVSHSHDKNAEAGWRIANIPFDPLQYQQQTEGLDVSLAYLENVVAESGPFDGVLGFSQGAAMAALLCQEKLKLKIDLRFVILCSGFSVNMGECQPGSIRFPSLHIFGNDLGKDRQIERDASRQLASLFEDGCSMVIEHELGHIIPTRSPYIDDIKNFLQRFL